MILMPYFYLIILLFFLFLYSLLITWQLYKLTSLNIFNRTLLVKQVNQTNVFKITELFLSLKKLSSRGLWFDSLLLLESQSSLSIEMKCRYFNAVGVIYQQMKQSDLAELYFLSALLEQSDYAPAVRNLVNLKD